MTVTTDLGTDLSRGIANKKINPNKTAAAAAVLTGGGLAAFGLSRRSWAGLGLAAGGAYLAYHGISRVAPYLGSVRVSYTINRSPEELYAFVRNKQNWVSFARGIEVAEGDQNEIKFVLGRSLGFELASSLKITEEKPGNFIAWSSLPGAIEHRGVMRFTPIPDRGTELSVALEFKIPAGTVTQVLGMLYGQGPEQLVRENLRRLKRLIETGEIPTTAGQPSGSRGAKGSVLRAFYRENVEQNMPEPARLAGD